MGVNAATTTTVVSAVDASDSWAVAARKSFCERELDAASTPATPAVSGT